MKVEFNMDIITQLKAESHGTPSGVAFRNLGKPGDNVSVKYHDNKGWSSNNYDWSHGTNRITESQARELLKPVVANLHRPKVPEFFVFSNGHILKREYGVVYLPINGGLGVDAYGKWVLRNAEGDAVDMDKYLTDIVERYEKEMGKPIESDLLVDLNNKKVNHVRVGNFDVDENGHVITPNTEFDQSVLSGIVASGQRDTTEPKSSSLAGRIIHVERKPDFDEIVVDGLTFAEAMDRLNHEEEER